MNDRGKGIMKGCGRRQKGSLERGLTPCEGDLLTIRMHHSGNFNHSPNPRYEGGKISMFGDIPVVRINIAAVEILAMSVGVSGQLDLYCFDEEAVLTRIDSESLLMKKCEYGLMGSRLIEIFVVRRNYMSIDDGLLSPSDPEIEETPDSDSDSDSDSQSESESESESESGGESDSEDESESDAELKALRESFGRGSEIVGRRYNVEPDRVMVTYHTEPDAECGTSREDLNYLDEYPTNDKEIIRSLGPVFNPLQDAADPPLRLGLRFASFDDFKDAVRTWNIKRGSIFKFYKNDKLRCRARCVHFFRVDKDGNPYRQCKWMIYAGRVGGERNGHIEVRAFTEEHTCSWNYKNTCVKSGWLARRFHGHMKETPELSARRLRKRIMLDNKFAMSKHQGKKVRSNSLKIIRGSEIDQYSIVRDYAAEIIRSNPGSTVVIKSVDEVCDLRTGQVKFERMYVCMQALKESLLATCRPFIGLDGTFLKGDSKGVLITAVGIDPNDGYFPFAWALVEGENGSSWRWFLELVRGDLQINDDRRWTLMSDKQKGLIQAAGSCFPNAEHRFCVRHLHANMCVAGFRGSDLRGALYGASFATTPVTFEHAMAEIASKDVDAAKWLEDKEPSEWSRSHFRTHSTCDSTLNNLCESFNSKIVDARHEPVVGLFEGIRKYLVERMDECRRLARRRWTDFKICPIVFRKMSENGQLAGSCLPMRCNEGLYEVECHSTNRSYGVNLNQRTCECRSWSLSGIPCPHAICAIWDIDGEPVDYVDECFSVERYLQCYDYNMMPLNGSHDWVPCNDLPLLPPSYVKPAGRPKKKRRRSQAEIIENKEKCKKARRIGQIVTCSICGGSGHNKRSCDLNQARADLNIDNCSPVLSCLEGDAVSLGASQPDFSVASTSGTNQSRNLPPTNGHGIHMKSTVSCAVKKKSKQNNKQKTKQNKNQKPKLKDIDLDSPETENAASAATAKGLNPMWAMFKVTPPKNPIGYRKILQNRNLKSIGQHVDLNSKGQNNLGISLESGKSNQHIPHCEGNSKGKGKMKIPNASDCNMPCSLSGMRESSQQYTSKVVRSKQKTAAREEKIGVPKGPHTARVSATGPQGGVFVHANYRHLNAGGSKFVPHTSGITIRCGADDGTLSFPNSSVSDKGHSAALSKNNKDISGRFDARLSKSRVLPDLNDPIVQNHGCAEDEITVGDNSFEGTFKPTSQYVKDYFKGKCGVPKNDDATVRDGLRHLSFAKKDLQTPRQYNSLMSDVIGKKMSVDGANVNNQSRSHTVGYHGNSIPSGQESLQNTYSGDGMEDIDFNFYRRLGVPNPNRIRPTKYDVEKGNHLG